MLPPEQKQHETRPLLQETITIAYISNNYFAHYQDVYFSFKRDNFFH